VDGLHRYFAASDFVITQSGYGKTSELSAIGVPFIAIPLDYHFEQDAEMILEAGGDVGERSLPAGIEKVRGRPR
jgi:UDP-N-acetylglucosamine:LPS N-acetylglucosamine transferase